MDIILPGTAGKAIAEEAKVSAPKRDMFNIYIAAFISLLISFVAELWVGKIGDTAGNGALAAQSLRFNPVANPISTIGTFVLAAVTIIVSIWLLHWLVSGLGGKGKYENLFHVLSIFFVSKYAFSFLSAAATAILAITFGVGAVCVVGGIAGAIGFYFFYLNYLIIRNTYAEIGAGKIILAIIGRDIIIFAMALAVSYVRAAVGI